MRKRPASKESIANLIKNSQQTIQNYERLQHDVYNRGIQMYRFPNSDVQKSVIFEGIKKRLKIV